MIGEIKKNDSLDNKVDARVHSIIETIINFIGLMIAIILCIIPISCIFNVIQGIVAGHSHYIRHCWTITPIPRHENSICWIIYFLICVIGDIIILKCSRR